MSVDRPLVTKEQTIELWDSFGSPAFFVTVKPMTPFVTPIEMEWVLDESNKMFLYKVFGNNWKRRKRTPKWCLPPEINSCKTTGNSYELFHYHGIVCIEKEWLKKKFLKEFETCFQKKVFDLRWMMKSMKNLQMPEIQIKEYNSCKDARGYALKSHGGNFDGSDCYVYGKESKISKGLRN